MNKLRKVLNLIGAIITETNCISESLSCNSAQHRMIERYTI